MNIPEDKNLVEMALMAAQMRTHLGDGVNNPGTIHVQLGQLAAQIAKVSRQLLGDDGAQGLAHRMAALENHVDTVTKSVSSLVKIVSGGDDGNPGLRTQLNTLNERLADLGRLRERFSEGHNGRPSFETRLDRLEVHVDKSSKIQGALIAAVLGGAVKFIVDALQHH